MAISIHPEPGTIIVCDFKGFIPPEMVKRRPAVVLSPRLRKRDGLCSVVPLSTTAPNHVMEYHHKLYTSPPLPAPYNADFHWVKADMLCTVSFDRLFLMRDGKADDGQRRYDVRVIDQADLLKIRACVLHALGMSVLTSYL